MDYQKSQNSLEKGYLPKDRFEDFIFIDNGEENITDVHLS
jgi:hypothetical protein